VIERGLHLPDAAELLRAVPAPPEASKPPAEPIPTVTLAEMYRAQGHRDRALATLEHVLAREQDHAVAAQLLAKWRAETAPPAALPPDASPKESAVDSADGEAFDVARGAIHDARGERAAHSGAAAAPQRTPADRDATWTPSCLAVRLPAGEIAVAWRVRSATTGMLALRTLLVRWDGARCHVDAVDREGVGPTGELRIPGVPRDVAVRVAIGTLVGGAFRPVAQAPVLEFVAEGDAMGAAHGGAPGARLLGRRDGAWTAPDKAAGWGAAVAFAESVLASAR
jgi:hypothetical protein